MKNRNFILKRNWISLIGLLKKTLCSILLLSLCTLSFGAIDVNLEPLRISHITTVVTVTTSATALPATALSGRKSMIAQNISTSVVYLGNADVTADETAAGGYQMAHKYDVWKGDASDDITIYAIVAAGSAKVVVWEIR